MTESDCAQRRSIPSLRAHRRTAKSWSVRAVLVLLLIATSSVAVAEGRKDGAKDRIYKINYKDIVKGRDVENNLALQANDTIVVP